MRGPLRELKPEVALKRALLEAICYDLRILRPCPGAAGPDAQLDASSRLCETRPGPPEVSQGFTVSDTGGGPRSKHTSVRTYNSH